MMTYRVMVRYVTTISVLGLAILGHVLTERVSGGRDAATLAERVNAH
jgi:hypothetical protein